jgi:hypothetical protein
LALVGDIYGPTLDPALWPASPENHGPCTIETLEGPFEPIIDEFPREVLKTYRSSKRTVCTNSPVDVSHLEIEPCSAYRLLAKDGQCNIGGLASTIFGYGSDSGPLAVKRTSSIGMAEPRQQQQAGE